MEENYYAMELNQIYELLKTDPKNGLTPEDADKRLLEYGVNEIPRVKQSFIKIYLAPLFNWLIVVYLIGATILFLANIMGLGGSMVIIVVTLSIVAFNCIIAIFQQYRATKKLNALREMSAPTTTVVRNGQKIDIPTKNVVKGDILVLSQGDKIAADSRIIQSANLEINEASLTGESEPVKKFQDGKAIVSEELSIGERKNMVFFGTFITTGTGTSIVVRTGGETEIGKISKGLEEAGTSEVPIRAKLNSFGKKLGIAVLLFWFTIVMIKWAATGELELVQSISSALDIMPINIPLLVTIILLTGVLAMAHYNVIIRNLASVDSLGRTSILFTDKTGTLTQNQMVVQYVWSNGSTFKITGSGYSPEGEIILMDDPQNLNPVRHIDDYPYLKMLLIAGYLNNNSALVKSEVKTEGKTSKLAYRWNVVGSPTEGALMVLFQKGMGDYTLQDYEAKREYPFDSSLKRMTKIIRKGNEYFSFTKGATEIIFPLCTKIAYGNNEQALSEDFKGNVMNLVNNYARQGYRILSLCYKKLTEMPPETDESRAVCESDLVYLGFVMILDPPRVGVKESVEQCRKASVDVIMITGDSPTTAKAIAQQISIVEKEEELAVQGKDIKDIDTIDKLNKIKVFARVSPKDKEVIVKKYQDTNRVVAMTGDGVNDALALNLADAGIAMGIQGTDVAKEASDMVIADDSFNSIVEGIHQGRGIFAKIRAVVFFYICINLFEGIVQFILVVILGLPYFLTPEYMIQWVFLDVTLHTFPGLALTFDSVSNDVMKEKPRDAEEILSRNTVFLLLIFGGLQAASMLIVYFVCLTGVYPVFPQNIEFGDFNIAYLYTKETMFLNPDTNLNEAKALTMLMATLFFIECFLVFQIRRPNKSTIRAFKEDSNKYLYFFILFVFALFLLLMYFPGVQYTLAHWSVGEFSLNFKFMVLTALDWLVAFAIAFLCIGLFEVVKYYARSHGIVF